MHWKAVSEDPQSVPRRGFCRVHLHVIVNQDAQIIDFVKLDFVHTLSLLRYLLAMSAYPPSGSLLHATRTIYSPSILRFSMAETLAKNINLCFTFYWSMVGPLIRPPDSVKKIFFISTACPDSAVSYEFPLYTLV
jgi:hypothetical protein